MKYSALILLFLGMPALAYAQSSNEKEIAAMATKCQSCHDQRGQDAIPRLNGQHPAYILTRLREFHDPASQSPHATYAMFDMASTIGASTAKALAEYFGRQVPTPAHGGGTLAAKGKHLYEARAVTGATCQSCHGEAGEGRDANPRLAGQHNPYLSQQLASFGLTVRVHQAMNPQARPLSMEESRAIVAYLGGD